MELTAISLFTGAMGLDLGFEQEGFEIKVAVEKDRTAVETIKANRPNIPVIQQDIKNVPTEEILLEAGLSVGEATVVIGAPPCEPFSTAGRRNGFSDDRSNAVDEFIRVISEARPRFFVMEEVAGFVHSSKKHISFYERVKKKEEDLEEEEKLGSAFQEIMEHFQGLGYALSYNPDSPKSSILNAADYGVHQKRKRFILIGSRDGGSVGLPSPGYVSQESAEVKQGSKKAWRTLADAIGDGFEDPIPEHRQFSRVWAHFLEYVPAGGCWRNLPPEMHKEALGGAYDDPDNVETKGLKGGRTGFLRKLAWDRPAPTLVDSPTSKSTCLCHPNKMRPLTVGEYLALQGFPLYWKVVGKTTAKYRLIGQATPVALAGAVAKAILVHEIARSRAKEPRKPVAMT